MLTHVFEVVITGLWNNVRVELVESFAHIGGGNGGYWEDQGYEWYAGI